MKLRLAGRGAESYQPWRLIRQHCRLTVAVRAGETAAGSLRARSVRPAPCLAIFAVRSRDVA